MTLQDILQLNIKKGHYISIDVESPETRKQHTVTKTYKVNGRFGVFYYNLKQFNNKKEERVEKTSKPVWFKHTEYKSIVANRNDESQLYIQVVNPKVSRVKYVDEALQPVPYKVLVEEGFIKEKARVDKLILTINLKNIKAIHYKNANID